MTCGLEISVSIIVALVAIFLNVLFHKKRSRIKKHFVITKKENFSTESNQKSVKNEKRGEVIISESFRRTMLKSFT